MCLFSFVIVQGMKNASFEQEVAIMYFLFEVFGWSVWPVYVTHWVQTRLGEGATVFLCFGWFALYLAWDNVDLSVEKVSFWG